jgi:hypothetical protein
MDIYHFRILLDSSRDVFRDIEISQRATFADLHNSIVDAFGFSGQEMASFYMSNDEWDKGQEIALMDMSDGSGGVIDMSSTYINDMVENTGSKLLYVYDFYRMWIFFVELVAIKPAMTGSEYPLITLAVGTAPSEYSRESADDMEFKSEIDDSFYNEDESLTEGYDGDDENFDAFDDNLEYH